MKRVVCALSALILLLSLVGCGAPAGDVVQPEIVSDISQQEERAIPELTVAVSVDDPDDLVTEGQERLMMDFLRRWYSFIGSFHEEDFAPLFDPAYADPEDPIPQAEEHAISCRTLMAIRQAAPENLAMDRCTVTLRVTNVTQEADHIHIDAMENTTMHFAALTVDSELIDLPHIFKISDVGDDNWLIAYHEADDNPYFSATYEAGSTVDKYLPVMLRNITRRSLLQSEEPTVDLACDVPYDREAALSYMTTYCAYRNPGWYAYDDYGGNCVNFASQVLLAGGIPMDYQGDAQWYWGSTGYLDLSFINVESFLEYARKNVGYGLVADIEATFTTGEVGDLLIFGTNSDRHAALISGVVTDDEGRFVDYLVCCNTTNYRNFPANAYYYTHQRLVKIYGWNNAD